jgi:hypothetical protein
MNTCSSSSFLRYSISMSSWFPSVMLLGSVSSLLGRTSSAGGFAGVLVPSFASLGCFTIWGCFLWHIGIEYTSQSVVTQKKTSNQIGYQYHCVNLRVKEEHKLKMREKIKITNRQKSGSGIGNESAITKSSIIPKRYSEGIRLLN